MPIGSNQVESVGLWSRFLLVDWWMVILCSVCVEIFCRWAHWERGVKYLGS